MAMEPEAGLTPLGQLGEFGLIERLTRPFPSFQQFVQKAVGDDAAVIGSGDGMVEVVSTDLLLEGIHFDLSYVPLRHLGYKAVAVNLSDIAAMNARPYGITVSVGMSNRFSLEAIEELYAGIRLACERYQVDLLGGDTSSSRQGLVLSVTALGRAAAEEVVYRSGARPGDLICMSGSAGAAYAGLLVLEREKEVFLKNPGVQPDLNDYDFVVGRQLKPEPRLDIIDFLRTQGVRPSAMIDVSDGVASELFHLCHQSGCGAMIYSHKLPIDPQTVQVAEAFGISDTTFAMNGGEDYELMFTIAPADLEKVRRESDISILGHMTDDPGLVQLTLEGGQVVDVEAQGWQHFSAT